MRVVLFNGPPRVGKDTAGLVLQSYINMPTAKVKFSDPLKSGVHATYGFPERGIDYYENCKDVPTADFLGMTPREAYIYHSEKYMKVLHGKEVYGSIAANRMRCLDPITTVLTPDSGFEEEALPSIREFGADNILLIRIHMDGKDFSNDSRSYLDLSKYGVFTVDVENIYGQLNLYQDRIRNAYEQWLQAA